MADRNDEGTRLGSLFKTAIIVAPIAVGGDIGLSRLSKQSTHFSKSVSQLPVTTATSPIRRFANRYASLSFSGTFKNWQLDKLAGFSANTSLAVDDIREAFARAARVSDPTGTLYRSIEAQLSQANTPQALYEDIAGAFQQNQSIYSERALRAFTADIELLESRAAAGLRISTAGLGAGIAQSKINVPLASLSPIMQADIKRAQELLGATTSIRRYSRPGLEGSELSVRFSGGRAGDQGFALRIPEEIQGRPGVITHGRTQQSQYIAGRYGLVEGNILQQSFKHEEHIMRRAVEDLIPQLITEQKLMSREIHGMVNAFEQKMLEDPELIPSLARGRLHEGLDTYVELRRKMLRLYKPGGERLSEFEYARLLRGGVLQGPTGEFPIFMGPSPSQIGKGAVLWSDPTQYSLFPGVEDWSRRPLQRYRIGTEASASAVEAMAQHPTTQGFAWARDPIAAQSPMVRAAFVSSTLDPQLTGTGVSAEGQFLLSKRLGPMLGRTRLGQLEVSSRNLVELEDLLKGEATGGVWNIDKTLPAGTFLGYDPRGEPVTLEKATRILTATAFERDKAKGDFIRLMTTEDIENFRYAKFFGIKGMGVQTSDQYLQEVLSQRLGMSQKANAIYQGIDALISMDELRKNRALHYNQMVTSLWDFTRANLAGGRTHSSLASNFANDPLKFVQRMNRMYFSGQQADHERALRLLVSMSRQAKLSPKQMGAVFGAVPEIFGGVEVMGKLSTAETHQISKGMAVGATQLFFEDVGGPGAGRMATFEPRAFELMGGPALGKVGPAIQQEIAERMIRQYPQQLIGQSGLMKSIVDLESRTKVGRAVSARTLIEQAGQGMLPLEESYLRLNAAGIGDVYIPGQGQIAAMTDYITDAGKVVHSDLAAAYRNLIDAADDYQNKSLNLEGLQFRVEKLKKQLEDTRISMVTAKGGLLRGRLPGSQFLTSVLPTMADASRLPERTVGITMPHAQKMLQQLEHIGMYTAEELTGIKQALESGERVPGIIGRHPYIGAFSTQAVYLQIVPGDEAVAVINEQTRKAMAFAGRLDPDDAAAIELSLGGRAFQGNKRIIQEMEGLGAHMLGGIRLSPAVGVAADYDADIFSVSIAGPKLQKELERHLASSELYDEYAIRQQLIKPKAPKGSIPLSRLEEMAEASIKLGLTSKESGKLGRVSNILQQYRAAVISGAGNLSRQEQLKALGLLEWLEQTPISGKHLAPGKAAETIYSLGDIEEALRQKNAANLSITTRKILSANKLAEMGILDEGLTLAIDTGGPEVNTRFIPGLDLSKTSENLMRAMSAFENMKVGDMTADRLRKLLLRKATPTAQERAAMRSSEVLAMSPFGAFFDVPDRAASRSLFTEITQRASSLEGQMIAAGKKLLTHAKPLLIGGAVAVGLANLLSPPPDLNIDYAPPVADMKGGTGGEDAQPIHPEGSVSGAPSADTVESYANKARLMDSGGQRQSGLDVSIRGSSNGGADYNAINEQMRRIMRGNTRVNSTIRDQRTSLTPQRVSSIIFED